MEYLIKWISKFTHPSQYLNMKKFRKKKLKIFEKKYLKKKINELENTCEVKS